MSITREDVLTVADVAALLDLKPYTVKEYAHRGILPGRKLGRTWRFLRPELEEAPSAACPDCATSTGKRLRSEIRSSL
jgi:excisionase family DNA binding protein